MHRLSLLLVCACALSAASHINSVDKPYYPLEEAEIHFEAFIDKFNRTYSSEDEKKMRFEIFKQKLEKINKHNLDPLSTAIYGITQFSDLTQEEFIQCCTGLNLSLRVPGDIGNMVNVSRPIKLRSLPDNFSWVDKGVVTRVKDQTRHCGSCWAFSTVGSIESAYARKYGQQMEFSEKQLVDCDTKSYGCGGGEPASAINYLISAGGIEGEEDYPYQPKQDTCQFDASKIKAKVVKLVTYYPESEEALRQILYTDGPLVLGMDATNLLDKYKGGIWTVQDCPGNVINHAILLVGYGSENGVPYWIFKNSHGTSFGENGYLRLKRNENTCGIMNDIPVRPVVG